MSDYAYITVTQGSNGTEIAGNTTAEQLYQAKRVADALERIAVAQEKIAMPP